VKTIVVVSGKGGAGKTSLAAGLVPFLSRPVLVDADVDASNLPLLFEATASGSEAFVGGQVANVRAEDCAGCLECMDACRFGALVLADESADAPRVDPLACEGCGVCRWLCPLGAIDLRHVVTGHWFLSETRYGPMVHARLGPGGENSGALVEKVRRVAASTAEKRQLDVILVDAPAGVGCPVISSLSGADLALAVAEPTPSGESDLFRVIELTRHFRIPTVVVINKADLAPVRAGALVRRLEPLDVPVVAQFPYDESVQELLCEGRVLSEASAPWHERLGRLWQRLASMIQIQIDETRPSRRLEVLHE
jgi:MinD superfamily P-loop ATPase